MLSFVIIGGINIGSDKPLIDYVVKTAEGLKIKPVVIIPDDSNLVKDYLGKRARYALQTERLGTGHAVSMAESKLKGKVDHVIALYGDMPMVSSSSLRKLIDEHIKKDNK